MWGLAFVLLLMTNPLEAADARIECQADDPAYSQAVAEGRYEQALTRVFEALKLPPPERKRFRMVQGLSQTNDDRHGNSDPETQTTQLDPRLFLEGGKSEACQGIVHELQHLRQFHIDRKAIHVYYRNPPPSYRQAWKGCVQDVFPSDTSALEQAAYDCVQENTLTTHLAAMEIEATREQAPYTLRGHLRKEDNAYLLDHLQLFADHLALITDPANESYYVPVIKKEDIRRFCDGFVFAAHEDLNRGAIGPAFQKLCPGQQWQVRLLLEKQ